MSWLIVEGTAEGKREGLVHSATDRLYRHVVERPTLAEIARNFREVNMIDLAPFANLVSLDHGLSTVVTLRPDHTLHTSVVNAGVIPHPVSGSEVVAFVSAGDTRKLAHLRANPTVAVVVRAGWQWAAVEGSAQLIGPHDPHPGADDERLRLLLRHIFTAAGGTHNDWAAFDRVMREERRTAVIVTPTRAYTNPT